MGTNLMRAAVVVSAICWAVGVAQGAASWDAQPYSVSIPTHINRTNQVPVEASKDMTLSHDVACDIAVSVAVAGDEVLTSSGRTLTTAYMLTGNLSNPDGAWVASATFINGVKIYHVIGTGPNSTITLSVQATPPSNQAPDAGTYTAKITLTASWL